MRNRSWDENVTPTVHTGQLRDEQYNFSNEINAAGLGINAKKDYYP
jgi:hypothetical protein